jgi:hypothetical protein
MPLRAKFFGGEGLAYPDQATTITLFYVSMYYDPAAMNRSDSHRQDSKQECAAFSAAPSTEKSSLLSTFQVYQDTKFSTTSLHGCRYHTGPLSVRFQATKILPCDTLRHTIYTIE